MHYHNNNLDFNHEFTPFQKKSYNHLHKRSSSFVHQKIIRKDSASPKAIKTGFKRDERVLTALSEFVISTEIQLRSEIPVAIWQVRKSTILPVKPHLNVEGELLKLLLVLLYLSVSATQSCYRHFSLRLCLLDIYSATTSKAFNTAKCLCREVNSDAAILHIFRVISYLLPWTESLSV